MHACLGCCWASADYCSDGYCDTTVHVGSSSELCAVQHSHLSGWQVNNWHHGEPSCPDGHRLQPILVACQLW
jgi:hypothetical protein